ncbi:MAG: hypothetical protein V4757_05330 [Pseudomonadota bacterium]
MRARLLFLPTLQLACGFSALFACLPATAQNRAVMQVSVTVVNTCQFGHVNSCALPGTRIVAAAATGTGSTAGAGQPTRQVLHL